MKTYQHLTQSLEAPLNIGGLGGLGVCEHLTYTSQTGNIKKNFK